MIQILLFLTILLPGNFFQDASPGQRVKQYNVSPGKPAISGYDPVDYFVKNRAVKGKKDFTTSFNGISYWFSSASNLEAFNKQPGHYEPQFGGWCAYAMGNDGSKVEVDPETFRVSNGKLYLFYNSIFNNTLKTWLKDEPGLMKKADANWPKFLK